MNEVLATIAARRSVRAYKPEAIPADLLSQVLGTAPLAPSGMNAQAWRFVALVSRPRIARLWEVCRAALGRFPDPRVQAMASREGFDPWYGAPVVVIASAEAESPTAQYDCACGLQNMMLAAQSMGLASCWVHVPARLDDAPESRELRAELGIPASYRIHGSIALGYAAGPGPKTPERKPGSVAILE